MSSHTEPASTGTDGQRAVDWEAVERSAEFQELVRSRRRFVIPATVFFLVWYLGFIALAGYAEDFMGESIYEGLTVGYGLALTQFVMVWGLGWWYLRRSDRVFEPLRERAVARAMQQGDGRAPDGRSGTGFDRGPEHAHPPDAPLPPAGGTPAHSGGERR